MQQTNRRRGKSDSSLLIEKPTHKLFKKIFLFCVTTLSMKENIKYQMKDNIKRRTLFLLSKHFAIYV